MTPVAELIVRVAERAGVVVSEAFSGRLAAFIGLLAKWNATLNLTGFELDPPGEEAVMKLVVEPLAADGLIPADTRVVVDVGSGGGSPALPIKLHRPAIQLVLVESKARKSAFLREAARHLELGDVSVETSRFEELAKSDRLRAAADLVTVRAVRLDSDFWKSTRAVLRPGGHVLLFGTASDPPVLPPGFELSSSLAIPGTATVLWLVRTV